MEKNKIDQYFLDKNLDVSFNTLGSSDLLVELFIKETEDIVHSCNGMTSNYVKHKCYSKYYPIQERTKFTGFEKFQKLDSQLRSKMVNHVSGLLGVYTTEIKKSERLFGSYLTELKNSFKKFKNPLLYLSGGIDSEFVALAMLDAGVQFTPVIFQWTNDTNQVYNIHDILYALDFCNNHNLKPIIRDINLEKLWNNPDFELLARETNVSSPQVNTYVYMIELMGEEFKNSTHILGGEVRFSSRFDVNSGKISNFALAAKVPAGSLGYNGVTYTVTQNVNYSTANTNNMGIRITYSWDGNYNNSQTWSITGFINGSTPATVTGGTLSGNWFTGPDLPGGTGFDVSTNNGVNWSTLNVGSNTLEHSAAGTGDSDSGNQATFPIWIRSKSNPGTVISASISFNLVYNYTPTLDTFTTNGSWTRPNSLIGSASVLVVGGGGAGGGAIRETGFGGEYNGAAGGGGAGAVALLYTGAINSNAISITVGTGGSGNFGIAGGAGGNSSATILGTTYTSQGGGGGLPNPNSNDTLGGAGGSNSSWAGGSGASGLSIEESYGGGGAGGGGAGTNATSSLSGNGGPSVSLNLTKAGSNYPITYGEGGDGGDGLGGASGAIGSIPGGGGTGGDILVYIQPPALQPTSAQGANGGAGRVYVYY